MSNRSLPPTHPVLHNQLPTTMTPSRPSNHCMGIRTVSQLPSQKKNHQAENQEHHGQLNEISRTNHGASVFSPSHSKPSEGSVPYSGRAEYTSLVVLNVLSFGPPPCKHPGRPTSDAVSEHPFPCCLLHTPSRIS
ncbi:hypothetical protein BR93DRAFT_604336 [Coniochaeta sp. PMI_546]|nr:hypothetical protein BR93DRAFT_604336 [Coniochaeta sp. PMI_546]